MVFKMLSVGSLFGNLKIRVSLIVSHASTAEKWTDEVAMDVQHREQNQNSDDSVISVKLTSEVLVHLPQSRFQLTVHVSERRFHTVQESSWLYFINRVKWC